MFEQMAQLNRILYLLGSFRFLSPKINRLTKLYFKKQQMLNTYAPIQYAGPKSLH